MGQRIRVLWLIKGLGAGGAERLLVSAARVGDHARFEYQAAYVVAHKDTLVAELSAHGVTSHCLSHGSLPWPIALRRLLLSGQYDVVHLHSPLVAGVARIVVRTLPRRRRPVVVSTEHNSWDSYSLPTRLLNASLHHTDRKRWAVSRQVQESVWLPLRKDLEVLIHGIVVDDVAQPGDRDAVRAGLGLQSSDVVGVAVANFRSEKAYPDLLRAAAIAFRSEPRMRLLIVGQGPLEQEVRALHSELGLGDRCRILGYRKDVLNVLAASDFFVLSSRFEGLPVALMEAMAVGLPVVATRVGGIPDAVAHRKEGLLTPEGNPLKLAEAMLEITRDDARRREWATASANRGRDFDIRAAIDTVEVAYRETCAGPARPRSSFG